MVDCVNTIKIDLISCNNHMEHEFSSKLGKNARATEKIEGKKIEGKKKNE